MTYQRWMGPTMYDLLYIFTVSVCVAIIFELYLFTIKLYVLFLK